MEKREFKSGDCYRICPKCGEWVAAKEMRCDKCLELLSGTQLYWVTEEDLQNNMEIQEEKPEDLAEEILVMCCHTCNNTYAWGSYTQCPNCGDTLIPETQGRSIEIDSHMPKEATIYEKSGNTFCYTLVRHTSEGERQAKQQHVPFIEEEVFGRNKFLRDPRFFFEKSTRNIQEYFANISRDNVVIRQNAGRLSVEVFPDKRKVTLNGKKLEAGIRYELREGDLLRFGEGYDLLHLIDLKIERMRENQDSNQMQAFEEMFRGFQEQVTSRLEGIEKIFENIRPEDLVMRANESEEDYSNRIGGLMPNMSDADKVKEIRKFLQIIGDKGMIYDCSNQVDAIASSKQLMEYIFQAAVLESVCNTLPDDMDYSTPMSKIGLAFEEFVMVYILSIIYKADKNAFDAYVKKNPKIKNKNSVQQGAILVYLLESDEHIRTILRAAGYNEWENSRLQQLKKAIRDVQNATYYRNATQHAGASKNTAEENLNNYKKKNESSRLSKNEYMKQKEAVFRTNSISVIYQYYLRIFKDEVR